MYMPYICLYIYIYPSDMSAPELSYLFLYLFYTIMHLKIAAFN